MTLFYLIFMAYFTGLNRLYGTTKWNWKLLTINYVSGEHATNSKE